MTSKLAAITVREEPGLLPEEKETTIRFSERDQTATVFTSQTACMRRLLGNPNFEPQEIRVLDDGERRYVEHIDDVGDGQIIAVIGEISTVPSFDVEDINE